MSWAAKRQTTRLEDIAYCLLGIFDINMSLLYGEREKAFRRLQEEILKEHDDRSILAWSPSDTVPRGSLARNPTDFLHCGTVHHSIATWSAGGFSMTPTGLRIHLRFVSYNSELLAILGCIDSSSHSYHAIPVTNHHGNLEQNVVLYRVPDRTVVPLPYDYVLKNMHTDFETVLLAKAAKPHFGSEDVTSWMNNFAVFRSYGPDLVIKQPEELKLDAVAWWPKCDIWFDKSDKSDISYHFNPLSYQARHMVVLLREKSSSNGGACCLAMGYFSTACGAIDTQRPWVNYVIDAHRNQNVQRKTQIHRNTGLSREDAYAKAWYEVFLDESLQWSVSQQPLRVEAGEEVFTVSVGRRQKVAGATCEVNIDRESRRKTPASQ
jgi:hypothetical protein